MEPFWENIFRKDRKEKSAETALRQNILFQDLNPAEISWVQKIVNVRSYAPGETIFQQGEIGVGMYIIIRGSVDIVTEDVSPESGKSMSQVVTRLTDGDFFGEIALVEETSRRTATARCQEETLLLGFFKPDLMEIVSRKPASGVKILLRLSQILGGRLSETTKMIRHLRHQIGTVK
ncbi:MAG: cyclic nucleotide-binding domain-containing protein [Bdellovibrionaceae bacterium]|nr:cyclic nucleotide-binding domain-containing protein [Pseudobdellovibrionaceae bacterium]